MIRNPEKRLTGDVVCILLEEQRDGTEIIGHTRQDITAMRLIKKIDRYLHDVNQQIALNGYCWFVYRLLIIVGGDRLYDVIDNHNDHQRRKPLHSAKGVVHPACYHPSASMLSTRIGILPEPMLEYNVFYESIGNSH